MPLKIAKTNIIVTGEVSFGQRSLEQKSGQLLQPGSFTFYSSSKKSKKKKNVTKRTEPLAGKPY